ncbi:MAG: sugar nucleotide-binding protein [Candidatus Peribacteraceae bacterium]|jgi:dTDP-4-dehydrorhamnose reductase
MNVLIFGSKGYLGSQFLSLYPDAITPSVDVADQAAVATLLDKEKPDVVINAAGKTGRPNVDWCETHREETFRSNVTGVVTLLEECGERGIYWVHLGSGCIYEGENGGGGYTEEDPPNFAGSFYSWTKNVSDQMLMRFGEGWKGRGGVLNLRLRMPFDTTQSPRNLLMKLKGYTRVLDVRNSITFIPEFTAAAQRLIAERKTGTYNMVNGSGISPYRIMELYKEIVDPSHAFERLTLEQLPDVAKAARSNCILNNAKLLGEGIPMGDAEETVRAALRTLRKAP